MTLSEFISKCEKDIKKGWFIAELSDEYIVDDISELNSDKCSENKVLEIRAFNDDMEHKLFRTDISRDFHYRVIKDSDYGTDQTIDEVQILDIDTARSEGLRDGYVMTTGGGKYHLPLEKYYKACVKIRYYLERYEETGQARVADWRIVKIEEGDKGENR